MPRLNEAHSSAGEQSSSMMISGHCYNLHMEKQKLTDYCYTAYCIQEVERLVGGSVTEGGGHFTFWKEKRSHQR